jgi:pre-mRNA-processing factor 8
MEWLEAATQLVAQGHHALTLLIHKKGLTYLHLDYAFNLKPIRTLTTKERKRGRFGSSFHLVRELLRLVKLVTDAHVHFRLGNCDAFALADAVMNIFGHVGHLTGLYRYKYRVMRQIRRCKALQELIELRFATGPVAAGPGCGFWHPLWRTWIFYLRGLVPLLQEFLSNLLSRQFVGRKKTKDVVHRVTKQRSDANFDLELRAAAVRDILDAMPEEVRASKSRLVMHHLSEAWRCYRADVPWEVEGMPPPVAQLIRRYVEQKARWWSRMAGYNRARTVRGITIDKAAARRNEGVLARLYLKEEASRQARHRAEGPFISVDDAVGLYTTAARWLESRRFRPIPLPPVQYKHDTKLLVLALERLREPYNLSSRLSAAEREELALIEAAYDNPHKALLDIKQRLVQARDFQACQVELVDELDHLHPTYAWSPIDKLADAYLAQYLWFEASRRSLFPYWANPSDSQVAPAMVHQFLTALNNVDHGEVWDTGVGPQGQLPPGGGPRTVLLSFELEDLMPKAEPAVIDRLLGLIIDPSLASYMAARNNALLRYKDMSHRHSVGLLRGLLFSSFVEAYYKLLLDVCILGVSRATDLIGPPESPNPPFRFADDLPATTAAAAAAAALPPAYSPSDPTGDAVRLVAPEDSIERRHPVRLYLRNHETVYILYRFTPGQAEELVGRFREDVGIGAGETLYSSGSSAFEPINPTGKASSAGTSPYASRAPEDDVAHASFPICRAWPPDGRMRHHRVDTLLGRAAFWAASRRLPASIATVRWSHPSTMPSVYSATNPFLFATIAGFTLRVVPRSRLPAHLAASGPLPGEWELVDRHKGQRTALAHLRVSAQEVTAFQHRVRLLLMGSGSSPFVKVAARWNALLLSLVAYFREAVAATPELVDLLIRSENRVQTRVKMGLNSKMPSRFPPAILYAPHELGGLGMLSAGHVLVAAADLRYAAQSEAAAARVTHFRSGLTHEEGSGVIPNVSRYFLPWAAEIESSARVWADYKARLAAAEASGSKLGHDDLEDSWDCGLPRIATLFQRDRHTLAYDRGWRQSAYQSRFFRRRLNAFWWTSDRHDGRLWNLTDYRTDMIQALGGVENILKHSLFAATGFTDWQGAVWQTTSQFESSMQLKRLTNAQRMGLNQVPNRRFTLWWSPTLNRSAVYVGFQVQLDLTGIFMHGKLPTLKVSLVQVFRAHLWQKIHESLVLDLLNLLDQQVGPLGLAAVEKQAIHPRKSYRMSASCADIVLEAQHRWPVAAPSGLDDDAADAAAAGSAPQAVGRFTDKLWIDVQLRWGDYDSHDTPLYARARYFDFSSDALSVYPCATGVIVAFDLAYNTWSAFGNWVPGLKGLLRKGLAKISQSSPALHVLHERVQKSLQLHSSTPTEPFLSPSNFPDLFSPKTTWILDDTHVYRIALRQKASGAVSAKPINGALSVLNPVTGDLFLKVIHESVFAGQTRRSQLAKWKAAEEAVTIVKSLPPEQQPNQLIVARASLLDPLEVHLLDFPNLSVKGSQLKLPFGYLIDVDKVADIVNGATEPKLVLLNLYDDWLVTIPAQTAFLRLLLILRAVAAGPAQARAILRPTPETVTAPTHLWPTFSPSEWAAAELALKDLIIATYARKNSVSADALTQTEVRDVILGAPVARPSDERQAAVRDIDEQAPERSGAVAKEALATRASNVLGEDIVVVTTTQYERKSFVSRTDVRLRAVAAAGLALRARHITVPPPPRLPAASAAAQPSATAHTLRPSIVIPSELVRQLVAISDLGSRTGVLLYGRRVQPPATVASGAAEPPKQVPRFSRSHSAAGSIAAADQQQVLFAVCAAVVPPQIGTLAALDMACAHPPAHGALAGLIPLGWMYSRPSAAAMAAVGKRSDDSDDDGQSSVSGTSHRGVDSKTFGRSARSAAAAAFASGDPDAFDLDPAAVRTHATLATRLGWPAATSFMVQARLSPGGVTLSAWRPPLSALAAAGVSADQMLDSDLSAVEEALEPLSVASVIELIVPPPATAPDHRTGQRRTRFFSLVPPRGAWNLVFSSAALMATEHAYQLELGEPLPFFAAEHRPRHFVTFAGAGSDALVPEVEDQLA